MRPPKRRLLALVIVLLATVAWPAPSPAQETREAPAFVLHKVDDAGFAARRPTDPFFVLLIGNDGRPGLEGVRGDGIHIVGVNPAAGRATILNIPRDTWVDIPGFGFEKITRSMEFGGLQTQVKAVSALTGVPFSFAVTTSFEGFIRMVDEMGGLHVEVASRMFDKNSGADFEPGRRHMLGAGALSYARNRNIPNGDISRTTNQGWLLLAGLERAREVTQSPFGVLRLLGITARNVELDGVGLRDLYGFYDLGLSLNPANVRNVTMPSSIGKVGRADVVFAAPAAAALFEDLRDNAILDSH